MVQKNCQIFVGLYGIIKMRVLKDTDHIQVSKKIEFKQKLVYSKNEGFNGHRWYSNFQEN